MNITNTQAAQAISSLNLDADDKCEFTVSNSFKVEYNTQDISQRFIRISTLDNGAQLVVELKNCNLDDNSILLRLENLLSHDPEVVKDSLINLASDLNGTQLLNYPFLEAQKNTINLLNKMAERNALNPRKSMDFDQLEIVQSKFTIKDRNYQIIDMLNGTGPDSFTIEIKPHEHTRAVAYSNLTITKVENQGYYASLTSESGIDKNSNSSELTKLEFKIGEDSEPLSTINNRINNNLLKKLRADVINDAEGNILGSSSQLAQTLISDPELTFLSSSFSAPNKFNVYFDKGSNSLELRTLDNNSSLYFDLNKSALSDSEIINQLAELLNKDSDTANKAYQELSIKLGVEGELKVHFVSDIKNFIANWNSQANHDPDLNKAALKIKEYTLGKAAYEKDSLLLGCGPDEFSMQVDSSYKGYDQFGRETNTYDFKNVVFEKSRAYERFNAKTNEIEKRGDGFFVTLKSNAGVPGFWTTKPTEIEFKIGDFNESHQAVQARFKSEVLENLLKDRTDPNDTIVILNSSNLAKTLMENPSIQLTKVKNAAFTNVKMEGLKLENVLFENCIFNAGTALDIANVTFKNCEGEGAHFNCLGGIINFEGSRGKGFRTSCDFDGQADHLIIGKDAVVRSDFGELDLMGKPPLKINQEKPAFLKNCKGLKIATEYTKAYDKFFREIKIGKYNKFHNLISRSEEDLFKDWTTSKYMETKFSNQDKTWEIGKGLESVKIKKSMSGNLLKSVTDENGHVVWTAINKEELNFLRKQLRKQAHSETSSARTLNA
jgi:hypothetical protein